MNETMNDRQSNDSPAAPLSWRERLLAVVTGRATSTARSDLADALAGGGVSDFSAHEQAMIQNVLKLRGTRVEDVMVPRADIIAIAGEITLGDLLKVFRTAGHSRLPVYGETLDDPRGMIHIRDFLDFLAASAERSSRSTRRRKVDPAAGPNLAGVNLSQPLSSARILRPVIYAPPSMPALDLLVRMQATRTHMALVIDEYGGTDGLVSIEDLVEMVVGDIEDEHDDDDAPSIVTAGDGVFNADARASLEDVSEAIGVDLGAGDLAEEVDTLGGLIVTMAGRVPVRGELIAGPDGLEFEVLDADARRVKRLRIHRRAQATPAREKQDMPARGKTAAPEREASAAPAEPASSPSGEAASRQGRVERGPGEAA